MKNKKIIKLPIKKETIELKELIDYVDTLDIKHYRDVISKYNSFMFISSLKQEKIDNRDIFVITFIPYYLKEKFGKTYIDIRFDLQKEVILDIWDYMINTGQLPVKNKSWDDLTVEEFCSHRKTINTLYNKLNSSLKDLTLKTREFCLKIKTVAELQKYSVSYLENIDENVPGVINMGLKIEKNKFSLNTSSQYLSSAGLDHICKQYCNLKDQLIKKAEEYCILSEELVFPQFLEAIHATNNYSTEWL